MYDDNGKDPFEEDPFGWDDVRTGQPMYGGGMGGMGADAAAAQHEAGHSGAVGAEAAQDQTAGIAGGITNLFKAASEAVGYAQAGSTVQRLQQQQALQAKQAQQAALAARTGSGLSFKSSLFSRYGVVFIMGAIAVVGGIVWYAAKKKRTVAANSAWRRQRRQRHKHGWRTS